MEKYVRSELLPIDEIVDELYDFSKLGALSVPNILTENARHELLKGISSARSLFHQVQREVGSVIQEMEIVYLEQIGGQIALFPLLERAISRLSHEYSEVYGKIAVRAGFHENTFNSIGIHRYPIGSCGITPHQDYAADANLVTSFVISGNASFFVCANREKECAQELESSPGTIIFMRAARREVEQKKRPFHYLVGPMREDRYSILIRHRREEKMSALAKEDAYG